MLKLTVLHTNDLHGRVEQLSRIATLVRKIRAEVTGRGEPCYYFDCGDSEDTRLLESSLTKGASMEALLNAAGCDAAALGNAIPIRYGYQAVKNLAQSLGQPLLCANLFDETGKEIEGLQAYRLVKAGNVTLGLIGLTDPIQAYSSIFHMRILNPHQALPDLIAAVRAQGAQTVILLSHLSSRVDLELAQSVEGVDLILGGHDHKILYPPKQVNGCLVAQTGQYGEQLGRLDLEVEEQSGKIIGCRANLLEVSLEIPPDAAFQQAVAQEQQKAHALMQIPVGQVDQALDLAIDRECAAGDLLADALLERFPQAQCALALAGHWLTGLPAGKISQGGLLAACRSSANPGITRLSGLEIINFLRAAMRRENYSRVFDHELRGGFVGLPHPAGMTLQWDGQSPDSIKVWVGGDPLKMDQNYWLATTDMEYSEFIGYLLIPDERVRYEVPIVVPEVLQEYLKRHSPIRQISGDRLRVC